MNGKTYFIQDTRQYVGNCMLFHAKSNGYTTHLDEALECGEEEARAIKRNRNTDKAWPAEQIRAAASVQVDVQRIRPIVDVVPCADIPNGVIVLGAMRKAEGECSDPRDRYIMQYELVASTNLENVDVKCSRCGARVVNLKWV